jgi:lipopolysaccharide assembly protein A
LLLFVSVQPGARADRGALQAQKQIVGSDYFQFPHYAKQKCMGSAFACGLEDISGPGAVNSNSGIKPMHFLLVVGVVLAIGVVGFALQNNVPATVNFAVWSFNGSLAVVLLIAFGMGIIIAGLMSSPGMIKCRWTRARLRHQVARLEGDKIQLERRIAELEAELETLAPRPAPVRPERYLGLKSMFLGSPEKPGE